MAEDVKVVTARRAYLYRLDDIRLSTLTTNEVASQLQREFAFKAGTIATPAPFFGLIPDTNPPGLVYDHGSWRLSGQAPLLIRFLHFEPQRVVIDVAGPSSAIDEVFRRLNELLSEVQTADGAPVLGEPVGEMNYSEITAQLGFEYGQLVSKPLLEAAERLSASGMSGGYPSSISFRVGESSQEIGPYTPNLAIQMRAGTREEERIFFSALWATTDDNIAWLEDLEEQFSRP